MTTASAPLRRLAAPLFAALLALLAAPAGGQIGPGPFAAFPTENEMDARMLSFGCAGLHTLDQNIQLSIAVPSTETSFSLSVFDGDTGQPDSNGKPHWDLGSRQLVYALYADPLLVGSTAAPVGTWTGNDPNPLSGPGWSVTSATMPDNDWWGVTVSTSAAARAPSGNYHYLLIVGLEGGGCASPSEALASDLKVAASSPLSFLIPRFGFEASMRQYFNDGPIVYPGGFPPADFLTAGSTYDGTFQFFLQVPSDATELRLFDGDFDHGSGDVTTWPSSLALGTCADTDDPDTDTSYTGFPFSTGNSKAEGVAGAGVPNDDNFLDPFRRGEPGDPHRMGCVRYEVIAPDGRIFRNDDPSGNLEWEQFRIASALGPSPGTADHQIADDYLPGGQWTVKVHGLDLSNLNFWYLDAEVCSEVQGEALCPPEAVYLIGDTVWVDLDGDGIQDSGENGIPGVVVNLYREPGGPVLETAVTGDTSSPSWTECVLNNTGLDEAGLYCFGARDPDDYIVEVAASNFAPGGPLASLSSTTGGEVQTDTVVTDNVLTYDFGYHAPDGPCGPCLGKVTYLTFQYLGTAPADVEVLAQRGSLKDDPMFSGTVVPNGTFQVIGPNTGGGGFAGNLGTEIDISVGGAHHVAIHTSCSQPIGPGMIFGDFLVLNGASSTGGPLCPYGADEPTTTEQAQPTGDSGNGGNGGSRGRKPKG